MDLMAFADNQTLRESLLVAYESCEPLDRGLLQFMSVIYEGAAKTTLIDYIRLCQLPEFNIKGFPQISLTLVTNRLMKKNLVVKGEYNQLHCHILLIEEMTRRAVCSGDFEMMAKAVQEKKRIANWGDRLYFSGYQQALCELRIAFYRGDMPRVQRILDVCETSFPRDFYQYPPWLLIFNNPLRPEDIRAFPDQWAGQAVVTLFTAAVRNLEPATQTTALAEQLLAENRCVEVVRYYLAEQALLRGDPVKARSYLTSGENDYDQALRGWLAFLDGANDQAIQYYENALKLLRKRTRKRKSYFNHLAGLFYLLALLASNTAAHLRQALEATAPLFEKGAQSPYLTAYRVLQEVVELQQGQRKALTPFDATVRTPPLDRFFQLMALFWLNAAKPDALREPVTALLNTAQDHGYVWFATELTELLRALGGEVNSGKTATCRPLTRLFHLKEPWEHALSALLDLSRLGQEPAGQTAQTRLVWWITCLTSGECAVTPREQKRDARGQWTLGRPVALKRLYGASKNVESLSPQDREICANSIRPFNANYYGSVAYEIDQNRALPLLVGHPLVFWEDNPTVRVDLVRGEPELLVTPKGLQWRLELSPSASVGETVQVVKETPTRLKVVVLSNAHQAVMTILGKGLLVPARAKDQVLATVAALSGLVTVQSSLDTGIENLPEVPASPLPHVHLLPFGEGLKIELLVRPFGAGPYYPPGSGGERVIAEVDGKRVQARRNLKQERQQATAVVKACPTLARQAAEDGEWLLEDPETCLEALLELQTLGDQVVLAWPEGEKFKVNRPASLSQLRLSVQRRQDWFNVDGELRLDNQQVLTMRQLLELLDHSAGRFVTLGEGQFLALTQEFRKRLEELRGFGELTAQGARFHPLAAPALEPLLSEAGSVRTDAAWKAQIKRLREAESLQPVVPSTLQAELRDYQSEGFAWLARLAYWGVGACLADDMGLGKTIQALALILSRAQDGPTLVVAPTSVCLNWLDEIRRFTPTLTATVFGSGDRQETVERMGPFDLLISSYGLMQQEAELLTSREWRTIVLDEGQSIKNMATKRSQAAMALRGDFKMIATGTPIENHLGELWNLFRFINPGLLGSLERFTQRFATPIEREDEQAARRRLKQLIQPFILRRLKSEVLEALPSRTEILLRVELEPAEAALYEALRQQSLDRLAEVDDNDTQKSFRILAELMKLRRACCHPKLVLPETELSGSKLGVFEEVLDELLENRHKALVFSQFVDHLAIIRDLLDRKGVAYQYLDGSTPAPERKKRVDAFQAGQGDVFLISLKAGGLGLNLTAADYVIHMDPWWNPAVEDQASDRAHRIGQQRPVTIYRLVTQGTIEEKIVALHHQKRDLAEQLLEGTGASGRVSAADLLRLLQEEGA
ncbi:MAG: DEAD/DEAH box helicase [Candidatus Contendobacter sp.]|jgi:superfamily II DNA or RNA helicase|nr:DEAD/DEAH box helicase [Gammaproteobacteria bacterium]MCC8993747.1 DEAD/DEAH box helicase [Candidatus Contendobacter sp.]